VTERVTERGPASGSRVVVHKPVSVGTTESPSIREALERPLSFTLPWPPTANHYWRHVRRGRNPVAHLLTDRGKDYRKAVAVELLRQRVPRNSLYGRLAIEVVALPPDRRTRDLDNLWKALLDSLEAARVILDDCWLDRELIERGLVTSGGRLLVKLYRLPVQDPRGRVVA